MNPPPPRFLTLTGNLLAEWTFESAGWSPGGTHRAQRQSFQVGGKGINVSKMLNRLGVPNTAIYFAGGGTGTECDAWLARNGFATQRFGTSQPTRAGVVVRASGVPETTFLGPDVAPDAAALAACAGFLDEQPDGSVLAVCGSLPGWSDTRFDVLRRSLSQWSQRGILIVDTYGAPLKWLAGLPLQLLKVNAAELRSISADGIVPRQLEARRYVITDGPNPVRFREARAEETLVQPPLVREVSPTGSGDVLLACLIDALFRQRKSLHEAAAYALPFAAANAAHPGVAEFPLPLSGFQK